MVEEASVVSPVEVNVEDVVLASVDVPDVSVETTALVAVRLVKNPVAAERSVEKNEVDVACPSEVVPDVIEAKVGVLVKV
jgi:hypothetical protein